MRLIGKGDQTDGAFVIALNAGGLMFLSTKTEKEKVMVRTIGAGAIALLFAGYLSALAALV